MTAGPAPLAPGSAIAPGYEVLEHLARSRALDVYDVWSEERDSRCVAKALRPDRLEEPGPRRRLLREGRILLAMAHPHVVRAYELVRGPRPVLILETLTGGSVQHMLDTGPARAPLPAVVELGVHLCSAMHYVHGQGLLHADLKPANVMSDRGFAKVIDFSHARCPGRAVRGRGTRAYMAPEQARGGRVGPPADVWGLGATLYAACVGRAPFPGGDGQRYPQLDGVASHVAAQRRLPRAYAPLGELIAACLTTDARRRPTVAQVATALDALLVVS